MDNKFSLLIITDNLNDLLLCKNFIDHLFEESLHIFILDNCKFSKDIILIDYHNKIKDFNSDYLINLDHELIALCNPTTVKEKNLNLKCNLSAFIGGFNFGTINQQLFDASKINLYNIYTDVCLNELNDIQKIQLNSHAFYFVKQDKVFNANSSNRINLLYSKSLTNSVEKTLIKHLESCDFSNQILFINIDNSPESILDLNFNTKFILFTLPNNITDFILKSFNGSINEIICLNFKLNISIERIILNDNENIKYLLANKFISLRSTFKKLFDFITSNIQSNITPIDNRISNLKNYNIFDQKTLSKDISLNLLNCINKDLLKDENNLTYNFIKLYILTNNKNVFYLNNFLAEHLLSLLYNCEKSDKLFFSFSYIFHFNSIFFINAFIKLYGTDLTCKKARRLYNLIKDCLISKNDKSENLLELLSGVNTPIEQTATIKLLHNTDAFLKLIQFPTNGNNSHLIGKIAYDILNSRCILDKNIIANLLKIFENLNQSKSFDIYIHLSSILLNLYSNDKEFSISVDENLFSFLSKQPLKLLNLLRFCISNNNKVSLNYLLKKFEKFIIFSNLNFRLEVLSYCIFSQNYKLFSKVLSTFSISDIKINKNDFSPFFLYISLDIIQVSFGLECQHLKLKSVVNKHPNHLYFDMIISNFDLSQNNLPPLKNIDFIYNQACSTIF